MISMGRKFWLVPTIILIISACSAPSAPNIGGGAKGATPTVGPNTPSPKEYTKEGFTIRFYSPQDGDIVNTPQVNLTGWTNSDTVMTINNDIYTLDGQKAFSIPLTLEEGPNAIEIVASDNSGNEIDLVMTITYESE